MTIEVKYIQTPHSCDGCDKVEDKLFIISIIPYHPYHLDIFLCPCCFKQLQSKISPLSVLIVTGQDTKP